MDFTGQYNFPGAQPYQFMSIPPLTPSHSHSAASDDFTTSPSDNFDGLPQTNDQFSTFNYSQGFNANPPQPTNGYPGPPTPPSQNAFAVQQAQQQQQGNGNVSNPMQPRTGSDGNSEDGAAPRGASEDDDNLTPAQSRRKAQNRAAYVILNLTGSLDLVGLPSFC